MTRYDYINQAWIEDGKYVRCGHPESANCNCYGKKHEGEKAPTPTVDGLYDDIHNPVVGGSFMTDNGPMKRRLNGELVEVGDHETRR